MAKHPTTHWLIIFCEVPKRRWLHDLLRMPRGFTHVCALGFGVGATNWMFFDWRGDTLDLSCFDDQGVNAVWDMVALRGGTIVGYWPQLPTGKWAWRFPVFNCVEGVKHLCRVRAPVFTPHSLYRWLCKNGAFPLMVRGEGVADDGADNGFRRGRGRGGESEGGRTRGGAAGAEEEAGRDEGRGRSRAARWSAWRPVAYIASLRRGRRR